MEQEPTVSDHDRLVFGAGFAFGVACVLLVVTMVTASASGAGAATAASVFGPVIAGVLAASVIGAALFLLAFPENRARVPFADGLDDDSA